MKLKEALNKLNYKKFNINFNYNEQYWELVIFDREFNILETHTNQYLKTVLENHFNQKIDFDSSKEAYYQNDYRNLSLNYDNTDFSDNFITLSLNDRYEDEYTRTFVIKNINDLASKLENLNNLFTDYELDLTRIFEEAREYGLYR
ncbi:hypothetical protein [Fusobacterium pseudoperiodonticum]|uniref:hypothetical protein n=1 Tax=Fusobacterium pseudoperiodonticum TaxID=2663009 RepID=UPI0028E6C86E|nr:hypothetical protein [Fusobacterium pseudoperiodonticum]